ncbi:MAG TPA: response regulator transcription factor [Burkholderiaceae bacterium]
MKILIVESSDHLAKFLTRALAGYILDRIDNGHDAFDFARGNACDAYDAIITDRILPGRIDGLGLICELRKRGNKTAIMVMGRSSDIDDWALCLACGADDYLIKPFSFDSLLARLAAVLRYRLGRRNHQSALTVGALHLDFFTRRVVINGQPVALNPREFQLLEYLVRNANQIVTRAMLLEHVWQNDFVPRSNVVDAHISNLRRKLEANSAKRILQTVRSEGYIFSTAS